MRFRHLDYGPDTEVTDLGAAALDDLLDRGAIQDWKPLVRAIARDPWGPLADTVLRICEAHPMYGTSPLFRSWIERRREHDDARGTTLAEARLRAGLTQQQVADRMGISQADVSKLERRADVRLSTLRAYARAIGGRLQVGLRGPDDEASRPLILPARRKDRRLTSSSE